MRTHLRKPPQKISILFITISIFSLALATTTFAAPAPDANDDCLELIAAGVAEGIGHAGAALGKSFGVEEDVGTGKMFYWFNASSAYNPLPGNPASQAGVERYGINYGARYNVVSPESGYKPETKLTHYFNLGPWGFEVVTAYYPNIGNPNEDVEDNFTDVAVSVASYYLEQYQTYGFCSNNPTDFQSSGGSSTTDDDYYDDNDYYDDYDDYDEPIYDDPDDVVSCEGGCPYAVCIGNTSYFGDPECYEGICKYENGEVCAYGCNDANGYCYQLSTGGGGSDFDDLISILLLGGGIITIGGGALGGGILGLRALRRRQAIKARELIGKELNRPVVDPREEQLKAQMQKSANSIDNLLNKLDKMEHAHLQHGLEHSIKMMESYHRSAAATENIEMLPGSIKKAADFAADLVGLAPGPGRYFKWGYHGGNDSHSRRHRQRHWSRHP